MTSATLSNTRANSVATLKQLLKLKQTEISNSLDSFVLRTDKFKILNDEDNDWTTVGSDIGSPISCQSSAFSTPAASPVKVKKMSNRIATTTPSKCDDLQDFIDPNRIYMSSETSESSEVSSCENLRPRAHFVAQVLTNIVRIYSGLNIVSVANKTAKTAGQKITSSLKDLDAESTFYVPNLPKNNEEFWMPTLCESVAEHIAPLVAKVSGVESVEAVGDAVEICVRLGVEVDCMTFRCKFAAEE